MKVTVCIGSSCHIKGSRQVVASLQELIARHHLENDVELAGTFCLNNCQRGVSVQIGETVYSVSPDTVEEFFQKEIVEKL